MYNCLICEIDFETFETAEALVEHCRASHPDREHRITGGPIPSEEED